MTFDQLYTLIQKGYTQDQIKDLYSVFGTGNPDPDPAPAPDPTPDKPEVKTPDPAPAAEPQPETPPAETETVKMLKEIIGMMQKGNINGIQNNPPAAESVEDILAKVINP